MNKYKLITLLFSSVIALSACAEPASDEGTDTPEQNTQNNANVINRNQLGEDYYLPVLSEEGGYATSNNRGITLNLNSGINISLFEKDLMRFSQESFPTDDYLIQEGQYLTTELIQGWLSRDSGTTDTEISEIEESTTLEAAEKAARIQSLEMKRGLNPAEAEKGEERIPRYLNSVLELDFLQQTEGGTQLQGMSIGLAVNSVDYYRTGVGEPQRSQAIPSEVVLEQGQAMANEIVRRIREIDELSEIPIHIGIYEQAAKDNLAGGVYVATGTSTNGSTVIQNWDMVNEKRLVFPLEGRDSAEWNAFANFQSEIEDFFPNLSGVTGHAHYIGESLENLTINIMTQFYGAAEMIAFTQYLKQSAETFLPTNVNIEIIVESPRDIEAFLKKEQTDTEYLSYVFN